MKYFRIPGYVCRRCGKWTQTITCTQESYNTYIKNKLFFSSRCSICRVDSRVSVSSLKEISKKQFERRTSSLFYVEKFVQ